MIDLLKELAVKKVMISDGAWGTLLMENGLEPSGCLEYLNVTKSQHVLDVAKAYVLAGAEMIKTNSFGANRFKLRSFPGLEDEVTDINIRAAEIAREAAGSKVHVLGSMGPTGKILMMEEVSEAEVYMVFREQAVALEQGGADVILIETMSDLYEAMVAIKAVKENTFCRVICTMAFDLMLTGEYRTIMGISPGEMTLALQQTGVDIIGANCGRGIEIMSGICREIREINSEIPVLIHANAGLPEYINGKTLFPETPLRMAGSVRELIDAGANIIGGCCGTTPEHIRQIALTVKTYR